MALEFIYKCCCGAEIILRDSRGNFINPGGRPDENGRIFTLQEQADKWLKDHTLCKTLNKGT